MSSGYNFAAAKTARTLRTTKCEAARLMRLTRFPETEPYWGKGKAYRFDDPAQLFGATYAAPTLAVAFAETILHQKGLFIDGEWVIDEANINERYIVQYERPANPFLQLADFTGASLKALGLNNDLCSSDDYAASMSVASALHAQLDDMDGIIYVSRQMNTDIAVVLFERSAVQVTNDVIPLKEHPQYGSVLDRFNVSVIPAGRSPKVWPRVR